MMLGPYARVFATVFLCASALCLLMEARALLEARAQHARAQGALAQGEYALAISSYRRSARWNAPGNVFASDSLEALEKIADSMEAQGNVAQALAANRAIHAALHASHGFLMLDQPRLARADAKIASLLSGEVPAEFDAHKSRSEREALYLSLLRGRAPHSFWVLFAFVGCVTWIVAAAVFLLRGVDERGRVVRQVARRSGFVLLLGWIAFALGLRLA